MGKSPRSAWIFDLRSTTSTIAKWLASWRKLEKERLELLKKDAASVHFFKMHLLMEHVLTWCVENHISNLLCEWLVLRLFFSRCKGRGWLHDEVGSLRIRLNQLWFCLDTAICLAASVDAKTWLAKEAGNVLFSFDLRQVPSLMWLMYPLVN